MQSDNEELLDSEEEEISEEEVETALQLVADLEEYEDWAFNCCVCKTKVYPIITEIELYPGKNPGIDFEDSVECSAIYLVAPSIHLEKMCKDCTRRILKQLDDFLKGE